MDRYQRKIGCIIQIPNLGRGQLKYVGPVDTKAGMFAGVDLLANIGKNDGSFMGRKYFDTEYPQSGLFIQLQKVASLIEKASISQTSRRTTMEPLSIPKNRSITRLTNQFSPMDDPKSPTPMRSFRITSRNSGNRQQTTMDQEAPDHRQQEPVHDNGEDRMEIDSIVSSGRKALRNNSNDWKASNSHLNDHNSNEVSIELREAQLTIEKLQRKQLHYKRLLDDQRMVLEEVQPTFDRYEATIQDREREIDELKQQLELEHRQQAKQKQFFDAENEQLLAVVSQLHEEIKENEERNFSHTQPPTDSSEDIELLKRQVEQLRSIEDQFELHKTKWAKEREQLKMHNDSLSKEYQNLSKELFSTKPHPDSSSDEVAALAKSLEEANERIKQLEQDQTHPAVESLPIFDPPAPVDSTAGRQQWCEHCDTMGHMTAECPHHDPDNQQFF